MLIELAGPDANNWRTVADAIVDTGADWTIVPENILIQIDGYELDHARLRSQWGEYRLVYRYEVDIRIGTRVFPNVLVVSDEIGTEVVLGRNLLNWLRMFVDGPNVRLELIE